MFHSLLFERIKFKTRNPVRDQLSKFPQNPHDKEKKHGFSNRHPITSYATHKKVAEVKSNGQKGAAIKNLNTFQHENVNMPTKIKC